MPCLLPLMLQEKRVLADKPPAGMFFALQPQGQPEEQQQSSSVANRASCKVQVSLRRVVSELRDVGIVGQGQVGTHIAARLCVFCEPCCQCIEMLFLRGNSYPRATCPFLPAWPAGGGRQFGCPAGELVCPLGSQPISGCSSDGSRSVSHGCRIKQHCRRQQAGWHSSSSSSRSWGPAWGRTGGSGGGSAAGCCGSGSRRRWFRALPAIVAGFGGQHGAAGRRSTVCSDANLGGSGKVFCSARTSRCPCRSHPVHTAPLTALLCASAGCQTTVSADAAV